MSLDHWAYEPSLLIGEMMNYSKELTQVPQRNGRLVELISQCVPWRQRHKYIKALNLDTWFIGKDTSAKTPCSLPGRDHTRCC